MRHLGVTRRGFLARASAAGLAALAPRASHAATHPTVLRAAASDVALSAGAHETRVWAYNGQVPGPLLRVRQGETLRVRLDNAIAQPTTVHWHGLRIDNAMDGVAGLTQEAVPTGGSFEYAFAPPDAGTFWYHPHNRSWEQVARGLAGVLIVDEPDPPVVDRDVLLVVDDWRLDEAGRFHEASLGSMHDWSHAGRLGNHFTMNGRPRFDVPVRAGERLRVRLVNVANARVMNLRFEAHAVVLIAIDGQPVRPRPVADGRLSLGPGQRVDLAIDMSLDPGARAALTEVSGGGRLVAGEFVYAQSAPVRENPLDAPLALPPNPLPATFDVAGARRVALLMEGGAMGGMRGAMHRGRRLSMRELVRERGLVWAFNGQAGMGEAPLFSARRGETVVVDMRNETAWVHAIHLHGHHVREIERRDAPASVDAWRDTVMVRRGESVRVAFVADNPGKWMLHCHMLEHQAGGMAAWFEVGG